MVRRNGSNACLIRRVILGFALLLSSTSVMGNEIQQGRIRIVLHPAFERFTPYLRVSNDWVPILVDKDPRTSYVTLLINNRPLRLGQIPGVRARVTSNESGGQFHWLLPDVEIKQSISFLRSRESSESDAIRVLLEITNLKDADIELGVRYTLDTQIGEKSKVPFKTPGIPAIVRETVFTPDKDNWYLLTENEEQDLGFQVLLRGDGITPVERVVIANWRRLSDAPWEYTVNPSRTFTFLPYSINDSAVALYYPTVPLKPRETRRVITVIGVKGSGVYTAVAAGSSEVLPTPEEISKILAPVEAAPNQTGKRSLLLSELARVEDFIDKLSKRVSAQTPLSVEEIDLYRKVLEELQKRAKSIESP